MRVSRLVESRARQRQRDTTHDTSVEDGEEANRASLVVGWVADLDERVARVLLGRDAAMERGRRVQRKLRCNLMGRDSPEARLARVEVWARQALVPLSVDVGRAEVTRRIVSNHGGSGDRGRGDGRSGRDGLGRSSERVVEVGSE